tara:strand:+ start:3829 stop:5256 length:1428 start_codon:yes stop_codon:yes gene_type:complete
MKLTHESLEVILKTSVPGCQSLVSFERLSGGASQETYRITVETSAGTELLAMRRAVGGTFRADKPADPQLRQPGLDIEAALMKAAVGHGVPAPKVHHILTRDDGIGDGFIMEWLEGEALGTHIVRNEEYAQLRPRLAYECGKAIARIHAIDVNRPELKGRLGHTSPTDFIQQTWQRYKDIGVPQPMLDYVGRWLLINVDQDFTPTLVHNDFRNGNFMVDQHEIIGVLDWELAHIGDPMRDLGWICTNAWRFGSDLPVGGFGQYKDLFRGYEEISGQTVDPEKVRFWEVFGCFWWSVTCMTMAEMHRAGPDPSVERAMIGRRASEGQIDCVDLLIPGDLPNTLVSPEAAAHGNLDLPRADELLAATEKFLRDDALGATQGRTNFLTRVSANVLGLIRREQQLLPAYRDYEQQSLTSLLQTDTDLESLRWQLIEQLRGNSPQLTDLNLQAHLRHCAAFQIAIDNPRYSGFRSLQASP